MKKLLSVFIAAALLLSFTPLVPQAFAAVVTPDYTVADLTQICYDAYLAALGGAKEYKFTLLDTELNLNALGKTAIELLNRRLWRGLSTVQTAYTYRGSGGVRVYEYTISWPYDEKDSEADAAALAAENAVASLITPGMTRIQKYKALHDWLALAVNYDHGRKAPYSGQSPWNALVGGLSVCNGYTKAYMLLCDKAGLPCLFVTGRVDGGDHAWNMVPYGGGWMYIDVTFDDTDTGSGVTDKYFMLSYSDIAKDHEFDADPVLGATLLCPERDDMGDALKALSLFSGTGNGYELAGKPDRHMGVAMFMIFLGFNGEYERRPELYSHPFTDVAGWCSGHIAVAYTKGLTFGVSATAFDGYARLTLAMFATLMLKALGYSSDTDFYWENAAGFAVSKGLLTNDECYAIGLRGFLRGDMVLIGYRALDTKLKDQSRTLRDALTASGAIAA